MKKLRRTFDLEDLADADFVSESIAEDISAKREIFANSQDVPAVLRAPLTPADIDI